MLLLCKHSAVSLISLKPIRSQASRARMLRCIYSVWPHSSFGYPVMVGGSQSPPCLPWAFLASWLRLWPWGRDARGMPPPRDAPWDPKGQDQSS